MSKYASFGKLIAIEGQKDALKQILMDAAQAMHQVDGCELYVVGDSESEPNAVMVMELWRDKAAHEASLQMESAKALIQQGRSLIADMDGNKFDVSRG